MFGALRQVEWWSLCSLQPWVGSALERGDDSLNLRRTEVT